MEKKRQSIIPEGDETGRGHRKLGMNEERECEYKREEEIKNSRKAI